jgi:hypothetical protein
MICDVRAAESSAETCAKLTIQVWSVRYTRWKIKNKVTNIQPAKPQLNHFALG